MPTIDSICCFVHTLEGPLKEFPCVDGSSPSSASAYILAQDGQEFSMTCSVLLIHKHMPVAATDGLAIQLRIDGVDEQPMLLDHTHPTITISGTKFRTSAGDWELRKFLFSSVELTEESGNGELTLENVNKLGKITVFVKRFKKLGTSEVSTSGLDTGTTRATIHEKTIKGRDISHSVQRAKGEYCVPPTTTMGVYLDTTDHPLMAFRFIYKSASALKNMGLIERSPSPPPRLNTEHNLNPAPVKNEKAQLKRERGDSAECNRTLCMRRQAPSLGDIETIDLTSDD